MQIFIAAALAFVSASLVSTAACALDAPPPIAEAGARPLVGEIYDARTGAALAPRSLAERIAAAEIVLLGERHDNADHHALQAWAVAAAGADGEGGRLVLEMVRTGEGGPLADATPDTLDTLAAALAWEESGWPDFALYRPILEAALDAGFTLYAGDAPMEAMRAAARGGLGALEEDELARLGLAAPFPETFAASVETAVDEGHCGLLPPEMIPAMAAAQRLRDAYLADALLADEGRAVLIAGAGHVGAEAVPHYLATRAPERDVLAIAFVEVPRGIGEPAALVPGFGTARAGVDIVWFTAAIDRGDVCAGLAARFGRN